MRGTAACAVLGLIAGGCAEGGDSSIIKADTAADVPLLETTVDGGVDTSVADTKGDATTDSTTTDATSDVGAEVKPDAPSDSTTEAAADTAPDTTADAPAPWRKTITIDGTNDFSATDEKFTTTSTSYDAFVTWDASALYVGYSGADLGTTASTSKWLFVYLDTDPGASTGATKGEQYKTQTPAFGTGFGAEAYFGYRTDGAFSHFKTYSGGTWTTVTTSGVTFNKSGSFVEIRIPFSAIGGAPAKLGVVTLMMNELSGSEWSYAGLYTGSYTDGYFSSVPVKHWLLADMTSSGAPNALTNRKP